MDKEQPRSIANEIGAGAALIIMVVFIVAIGYKIIENAIVEDIADHCDKYQQYVSEKYTIECNITE